MDFSPRFDYPARVPINEPYPYRYPETPDEVPHLPYGALEDSPSWIQVIDVDEDFGPTTAPAPPQLDQAVINLVRQQRMLTVPHLFDLPPIQWFIEDLLPAGPVTVVHGKGGARKSFLMLDWMLCADQSLTWHGHWVRPGRCLYMAGEGVQGLSKRIKAWCHHRNIDPYKLNIDFMAIPLNLFMLKPEQVDKWASLVKSLHYQYLVVDTLHTASSGADENSSQDIGRVYDNARRVAGSAQLFYLHHDPKQGKSARGSSAIRDDADVVIEIERDPTVQLTSVIKPDKIRDADDFAPLNVHFEIHGTGLDSSLYVKSIGVDSGPGVSAVHGQKIINILDDQPGLTRNDVLNRIGNHKQTRDAFDQLEADDEIYKKPGLHQEGTKLVQRDLYYAKGYDPREHGE